MSFLYYIVVAALAGLGGVAAFPRDSVTFFIDVTGCNSTAVHRPTQTEIATYRRHWTGTAAGGASAFFRTCSYGDPAWALDDESRHPIFDRLVEVPCRGSVPIPYDFDSFCGLSELYAAQQIAAAAYGGEAGGALPAIRIIANVPDARCTFYGVTDSSCFGDDKNKPCQTWVTSQRSLPQDGRPPLMNTVVHELGHTLGLWHSASADQPQWDYGDKSCVMGCSDDANTCYNAPQSAALGISRPSIALDVERALPLGVWADIGIPVFSTMPTNHATLRGSELGDVAVFLSARSSDATPAFDSGLSPAFDKRLSVHIASTSMSDPSSVLVGTLGGADDAPLQLIGGASYGPSGSALAAPLTLRTYGIAVRLLQNVTNLLGARLSICRFSAAGDARHSTCVGKSPPPLSYKPTTPLFFDPPPPSRSTPPPPIRCNQMQFGSTCSLPLGRNCPWSIPESAPKFFSLALQEQDDRVELRVSRDSSLDLDAWMAGPHPTTPSVSAISQIIFPFPKDLANVLNSSALRDFVALVTSKPGTVTTIPAYITAAQAYGNVSTRAGNVGGVLGYYIYKARGSSYADGDVVTVPKVVFDLMPRLGDGGVEYSFYGSEAYCRIQTAAVLTTTVQRPPPPPTTPSPSHSQPPPRRLFSPPPTKPPVCSCTCV